MLLSNITKQIDGRERGRDNQGTNLARVQRMGECKVEHRGELRDKVGLKFSALVSKFF